MEGLIGAFICGIVSGLMFIMILIYEKLKERFHKHNYEGIDFFMVFGLRQIG